MLTSVLAFSQVKYKRGQATIVVGNKKIVDEENQTSTEIINVEKKRTTIINRFRPVYLGDSMLRKGNMIRTKAEGALEITFFNNRKIRIYPNTLLILNEISENFISIRLFEGSVKILPDGSSKKKFSFVVRSPCATIRSTTAKPHFMVKHYPKNKMTYTLAYQGKLEINNPKFVDNKVFLKKGSKIAVYEKSAVAANKLRKANSKEQNQQEDQVFSNQKSIAKFDLNYKSKTEKPIFNLQNKDRLLEAKKEISNFREKEKKFYFQFDLGFHYITSDFYFYLAFLPKLKLGIFEAQLRFPVYFRLLDPLSYDKWYNSSEWNFENSKDIFEDIMQKIDHISYGREGKDFFVRLSEIPLISFSQGLGMKRYSNTISSPDTRRLGIYMDMDFETVALKGFISDITRMKVFGLRAEAYTFSDPDEKGYYKNFVAFSFFGDMETREDNGNPQIFIMTLDVSHAFFNNLKSDFIIGIFVEIGLQAYHFTSDSKASVNGASKNSFNLIDDSFAFTVGFKNLFFKYIDFRFEYRYLAKGYISDYVDSFYEIYRSDKSYLLLAKNKPDFHGFLFGLGTKLADYAHLYFEYYHETGEISGYDKPNNRFHMEIMSSQYLFPVLHFKIIYDRYDFDSFSDLFINFLGSNSMLTGEITYAFSKNFDLKFGYRSFFQKQGANYVRSDHFYINTMILF